MGRSKKRPSRHDARDERGQRVRKGVGPVDGGVKGQMVGVNKERVGPADRGVKGQIVEVKKESGTSWRVKGASGPPRTPTSFAVR